MTKKCTKQAYSCIPSERYKMQTITNNQPLNFSPPLNIFTNTNQNINTLFTITIQPTNLNNISLFFPLNYTNSNSAIDYNSTIPNKINLSRNRDPTEQNQVESSNDDDITNLSAADELNANHSFSNSDSLNDLNEPMSCGVIKNYGTGTSYQKKFHDVHSNMIKNCKFKI